MGRGRWVKATGVGTEDSNIAHTNFELLRTTIREERNKGRSGASEKASAKNGGHGTRDDGTSLSVYTVAVANGSGQGINGVVVKVYTE